VTAVQTEDHRQVTHALPSPRKARGVAAELLEDVGTRLPHVCLAGRVAAELRLPLSRHDRRLLVAAATLHDIGYSPALVRTGFHPLDAGIYLREQGYEAQLANLVANHSHAWLHCPDPWLGDLAVDFPRERSLLEDALVFCDMSSSPTGELISVEERLSDLAERQQGAWVNVRLGMLRNSIANVERSLGDSLVRLLRPDRHVLLRLLGD
jgi:hypothetical protein